MGQLFHTLSSVGICESAHVRVYSECEMAQGAVRVRIYARRIVSVYVVHSASCTLSDIVKLHQGIYGRRVGDFC